MGQGNQQREAEQHMPHYTGPGAGLAVLVLTAGRQPAECGRRGGYEMTSRGNMHIWRGGRSWSRIQHQKSCTVHSVGATNKGVWYLQRAKMSMFRRQLHREAATTWQTEE